MNLTSEVKRFNPHKMFQCAMIPNWLLRRKDVTQGAKLCYGRLYQYAGKDGECFPRIESLSDELGVSRSSISKYLKELTECKVLEVCTHNGKRSNSYFFLEHEWMEGWLKNVPTKVINDVLKVDTSYILKENSDNAKKLYAYFVMQYKEKEGKSYARTKIDGNLIKTLTRTYSYDECKEFVDYFFSMDDKEWWIKHHGYGVYAFYKMKDKIIKEMADETSKDKDFRLY